MTDNILYDSPPIDQRAVIDSYGESALYFDMDHLVHTISYHLREKAKTIHFFRSKTENNIDKALFSYQAPEDVHNVISENIASRLAKLAFTVPDVTVRQLLLSLFALDNDFFAYMGEIDGTEQYRLEIVNNQEDITLEFSTSNRFSNLEYLSIVDSRAGQNCGVLRVPSNPTDEELFELPFFISACSQIDINIGFNNEIKVQRGVNSRVHDEIHQLVGYDGDLDTNIYEYRKIRQN